MTTSIRFCVVLSLVALVGPVGCGDDDGKIADSGAPSDCADCTSCLWTTPPSCPDAQAVACSRTDPPLETIFFCNAYSNICGFPTQNGYTSIEDCQDLYPRNAPVRRQCQTYYLRCKDDLADKKLDCPPAAGTAPCN